MSQESYYWSELADFTHAKQVETFGWCSCEDNEGNENPFTDCPVEKSRNWHWTPRAKRIGWTLFWLEVIVLVAVFSYVYLFGTPLA